MAFKIGDEVNVMGKKGKVTQIIHTPKEFGMRGEGSTSGVGSELVIDKTEYNVEFEDKSSMRIPG